MMFYSQEQAALPIISVGGVAVNVVARGTHGVDGAIARGDGFAAQGANVILEGR